MTTDPAGRDPDETFAHYRRRLIADGGFQDETHVFTADQIDDLLLGDHLRAASRAHQRQRPRDPFTMYGSTAGVGSTYMGFDGTEDRHPLDTQVIHVVTTLPGSTEVPYIAGHPPTM